MKRKYFLRGLGIGIIVTALLLCISYRKQMTDMAIIEKAKSLGMIFPEKSEEISGSAVDVAENAEPVQTPVQTPEPTTRPTESPSVTPQAAPTKEPEVTKEPVTTQKPAKSSKTKSEQVTIKVVSGMDSSAVAKKLEKAGIIKSASKLDSYLVKNGYANRIVVGTHKFVKGTDFKEIAKILTK